ncbi:MAG: sirohydrochlorin cobaltochelatase [Bacillota bacterium]
MGSKKKAILLASVGTANINAIEKTLEGIRRTVTDKFPDYDVVQAFTSPHILKALREKQGIIIDSPEQAIHRLYKEGYEEVLIQSLHIIPGEEFHQLVRTISGYRRRNLFKKIELGRGLLHFMGDGNKVPDDYSLAVDAISGGIPEKETIILVGHGTTHPSNASYACLASKFLRKGINNVYLGTLKSYPSIGDVIYDLKSDKVSEVTLIPLMIVSGNHCLKDIASNDNHSWKSIFLEEGFSVNLKLEGLGDNPKIKEIFINHIEDAINGEHIIY